MASQNENQLVRFCEDVEDLCKVVADGIDGHAEHQSLKERLLKMADEAADFGSSLQPGPGWATVNPKRAVIDLDRLTEALL